MNPKHQKTNLTALIAIIVSIVILGAILLNAPLRRLMENGIYRDIVFIDLIGILAPLESLRSGMNPYIHAEFDPDHRPHSYGPLWLTLVHTGLGLKDALWLGIISACILITIVIKMTNPKNFKEVLIILAILFSPPITLGITRMNADVHVYLLVVFSSWLIAKKKYTIASGINLINFGLKYYPALILLYPITYVKNKKHQKLIAALLILTCISLWLYWGQAYEGLKSLIAAPTGVWTTGGPNLFQELGFNPSYSRFASVCLGLTIAGFLLTKDWKNSRINISTDHSNSSAYHLFIQSAIILLGASLLRESFSYRMIFILGMLPWIVETIRNQNGGAKTTKIWVLATIGLLWFEWIYITYLIHIGQLYIPKEKTLEIVGKLNFLKDILFWIYYIMTMKMFLNISNYKTIIKNWGN